MKLYDYSGLLKAIGDIQADQKKALNERLFSHKQQLIDLENKVISSGLLQDWENLKSICRKAHVSLDVADTKLDFYKLNGLVAIYQLSVYNYLHYDFGFTYTNNKLIWQWVTPKGEFETEESEILCKLKLLNTFMDTYEEYRDIQLQRVFDKMGEVSDNTKEIRKEI